MTTERLSPEEVALLIRARKLLKEKGLPKGANVKTICEIAGVSRKTGYQWAKDLKLTDEQSEAITREMERIKLEHEQLKARCWDLETENEGRRLAWKIHGVDELLAEKKTSLARRKRRSGEIFEKPAARLAKSRVGAQGVL